MTNTIKDLQFTQRQLVHVSTITFPDNQVPLWDLINQEIVKVYDTEELNRMGQGVVSKVNSIIRKVRQHWVINSSVNNNKSVDCNWNGDHYLWVSPVVSDNIRSFVADLV